MKVVVVGASGNLGTCVLRALRDEQAITNVIGLARRVPEGREPPYDVAEWRSLDLTGESRQVHETLVAAFRGADAVVHLVWAIQPNRARSYLRHVNVEGTRRVAQAAVEADVAHLVVASSWAVYSQVHDDEPRDEAAPATGIPSSHYSVDKAAQERVLDSVEQHHPAMRVSRMRTALCFQQNAGAQIARYFIGPAVPTRLLAPGLLPVLPMPTGLRLHVLHSDDAGRAYSQVIRNRAGGAFNVAAESVLWPADLARLVDSGRRLEIPPRLLRPLLHYAWRARLVASDAGWLDMATALPIMNTDRIRDLGWQPRHGAGETLTELLEAIASRRGTSSPALRGGDTSLNAPVEQ